jgi:hypothetical protein
MAQDKLQCQCSMTTKLVGSGCQYCNPEYLYDYDAQPDDPTGQAPCVRHCEATAFQIVIKNLRNEIERMKAAQPQLERNFCPRCGKRTADLTVIHTCTPPQENT